jgi:diacylglycerol kinase (ATP)
MESPYKGKSSLQRIADATRYSLAGLAAALRSEAAFRQELIAVVVLAPVGWMLGANGTQRALLIGSLVIVLIAELLNSAVEAVVDRVSLEHTTLRSAPGSRQRAVMLAIANAVMSGSSCCWADRLRYHGPHAADHHQDLQCLGRDLRIRALEVLRRDPAIGTHLVLSPSAKRDPGRDAIRSLKSRRLRAWC